MMQNVNEISISFVKLNFSEVIYYKHCKKDCCRVDNEPLTKNVIVHLLVLILKDTTTYTH